MFPALLGAMVHPYPRYCASFGYAGRHCYLLTFVTFQRIQAFTNTCTVDLAWLQILRAGREKGFEVLAASFMPDHLHMVVQGMRDDADLKVFAKAGKQYSGYYYAQAHGGGKLWQKGCDDQIVRNRADLLGRIRYVIDNLVVGGLVTNPEDYPFLRSQRAMSNNWSIGFAVAAAHRRKASISIADGVRQGYSKKNLPPEGGSYLARGLTPLLILIVRRISRLKAGAIWRVV